MMVDLAGGREALVEKIKTAVARSQYQWGLKLMDFIIDSEGGPGELEEELMLLRSKCLQVLAGKEVSAPGMNWYLTEDLVMRGLEIKPSNEAKVARIKAGDIRSLFTMLTCMLDAEATSNVTMSALFRFTDTDVKLSVVIRRGVCIVTSITSDLNNKVDLEVVTKEMVWREVMAKERTALTANMTGELSVSPNITSLATFFNYFDTEI